MNTIRSFDKSIMFILGLVVSFIVIGLNIPKASAAYEAGRLIDNEQFLDARSMSINDIQNFLISKNSGLRNMSFVLSCYGSSSKERQLYTNAGARCDTPIPASEIIYYASQIYGVNPKVILVTMQKEQSLTTAQNPTSWQLNQAMGYACPTSGSCDGNSAFPWQIDNGTWALRYHFERANGNFNWWTPSTSWTCGTEKNLYKPNLYPRQNVRFFDTNGTEYATVYIQNAGTSTMYCYTPHTYNNPQGLYGRAPYGTTGLYYSGSYNFVYFYELWFGSTQSTYVPFETSRWMILNRDQKKMVPGTASVSNAQEDSVLPAGMELKFTSKIWADNQWYYRTAYDTNLGNNKGIPSSAVNEIVFHPFVTSRWMTLKSNTTKYNPRSEASIGGNYNAGLNVRFVEKIIVNGVLYYRTQFDKENGNILGFPAQNIDEASYTIFETPRYVQVKNNSTKINPITSAVTTQSLTSGQQLRFSKKILLGNDWYCQTEDDANAGNLFGINCNSTEDIPYKSITNGSPGRWMQLNGNITKVRPSTGIADVTTYSSGMQVEFLQTITVNGVEYLRSRYDIERQNELAVRKDSVKEIEFIPFERPRKLKLTSDTYKLDPRTSLTDTYFLTKGQEIDFATKIYINGKWYFRSAYDTMNDHPYAIPANILE